MSCSGGTDCRKLIRSLLRPRRRIVIDRSRTVGRASAASARAWSRNGPSLRATGFEASTSGSRSSSAARRLTKVVLARRMNGGSRPIDSASATFWSPSARVVVFRLPISAARSSRRSATVVTSLRAVDQEPLQHRRVAGQLAEQPARGRQRRVQVLEADVRLLAPRPWNWRGLVLEERLQALARLRIERVEQLVQVNRGRRLVRADLAAVVDLLRPVRRAASGRCSGWRSPTVRTAGSSPGCRRAAAGGRP